MGSGISCRVFSALQDGTAVSEMCWNALLLSWSVQAWVRAAISHSKLFMKTKSMFVNWFICDHGSVLLSCFPSFMQTCVHDICICSKLFTYVSLWHFTQEKERNRVCLTQKGKIRNILKGILHFFWKYAHFTTPPELKC